MPVGCQSGARKADGPWRRATGTGWVRETRDHDYADAQRRGHPVTLLVTAGPLSPTFDRALRALGRKVGGTNPTGHTNPTRSHCARKFRTALAQCAGVPAQCAPVGSHCSGSHCDRTAGLCGGSAFRWVGVSRWVGTSDLPKHARAPTTHDSTRYGLSRSSPRTFLAHHRAAISGSRPCSRPVSRRPSFSRTQQPFFSPHPPWASSSPWACRPSKPPPCGTRMV